jgi:hypothetical protein
VIKLRSSRRTRVIRHIFWTLVVLSVPGWIAADPATPAFLYGSAITVCLIWILITRRAIRRYAAGTPTEITVTREGLSAPLWSLPWDRVDHAWIASAAGGKLSTLNVEPRQPDDIQRTPLPRLLKVNVFLGQAMNMSAIQIPQTSVDMPLAELLAVFEAKAGRSLSLPA